MGKKHSKPKDRAVITVSDGYSDCFLTIPSLCTDLCLSLALFEVQMNNKSSILGFRMLLTHIVFKKRIVKMVNFETLYTQQPNLTSSPKTLTMKTHCWTSSVSLNSRDATFRSQYIGYLNLLTL